MSLIGKTGIWGYRRTLRVNRDDQAIYPNPGNGSAGLIPPTSRRTGCPAQALGMPDPYGRRLGAARNTSIRMAGPLGQSPATPANSLDDSKTSL